MFKVSVVAYSQNALMSALNSAWAQATKLVRNAGDTANNGRAVAGVVCWEATLTDDMLEHEVAERLHAVDALLRERSGYNGLRAGGWLGEAVSVVYAHPLHVHRLAAVQGNCEVVALLHDDLLDHMEVRLVMDPTDGSRDIAWQGSNSLQCARVDLK